MLYQYIEPSIVFEKEKNIEIEIVNSTLSLLNLLLNFVKAKFLIKNNLLLNKPIELNIESGRIE